LIDEVEKGCMKINKFLKVAIFLITLQSIGSVVWGEDKGEILLDETVAVIVSKMPPAKESAIITAWDLEAHCRIELIKRYGKDGTSKVIGKSLKISVLKNLIEQEMVFLELKKFGMENEQLNEENVNKKMEELANPFGSSQAFFNEMSRFSIEPQMLIKWIKKEVQVEQYLEAQFKMSYSTILKDGEIQEADKVIFRDKFIEKLSQRYRIRVYIEDFKWKDVIE